MKVRGERKVGGSNGGSTFRCKERSVEKGRVVLTKVS